MKEYECIYCKIISKDHIAACKEVDKLKQQLAERDALILELEKVREFYAHPVLGHKINELARTPLKNQKLLDEIKGRV